MAMRAEWLHASAETSVQLGLEGCEPGLMGWEDTLTPGGLFEGLAGSWGGVILPMGTLGWCEARYLDEHLHAAAKKLGRGWREERCGWAIIPWVACSRA